MRLGRLERNSLHPVHHRHGEIVIDRHIGANRADMRAQFGCKFGQPAFARGLEPAPVGIEPVDRFGNIPASFGPAARPAMIAQADRLPPHHVEEHGVDSIAPCDLGRLHPDKVPVFGVVQAAQSIARGGKEPATQRRIECGLEPPFGMFESRPIVEIDAVIGAYGNGAGMEKLHDFSRRIAPGKGCMLLSGFGGPVAKPDMRLEIDHRRATPRGCDAFDGLGGVIVREKARIPVRHMHVDEYVRIGCLMPGALRFFHARCHTCFHNHQTAS